MAQIADRDGSSIAALFTRVQQRAKRRMWSIEGVGEQVITFHSYADPDAMSARGFEDLAGYMRRSYGVDLAICGGGYGCFQILANAIGPDLAGGVVDRMADDPRLHAKLNENEIDRLDVKTPRGDYWLEARFPYSGFCFSNRQPIFEAGALKGFADAEGNGVRTARVDVELTSRSRRRSGENLLRRVWRKLKDRHGFRPPLLDVELVDINSIPEPEVKSALRDSFRARAGALLYIHGVNTTFHNALQQWSGMCHHVNTDALACVPMFFSWPAQSGKTEYTRNVNYATRSRAEFLSAAKSICATAADRQVDLVAHSQGCRLTLQSIVRKDADSEAGSSLKFKNLVYIAPDIDEKEFKDDIPIIARQVERISVYTSTEDEALKLSKLIWGAGRVGSAASSIKVHGAEVDFVDVSEVARSIDGHSYFLDFAEVVEDLFHVLKEKGDKVITRNRRRLDSDPRCWRLLSTEPPILRR